MLHCNSKVWKHQCSRENKDAVDTQLASRWEHLWTQTCAFICLMLHIHELSERLSLLAPAVSPLFYVCSVVLSLCLLCVLAAHDWPDLFCLEIREKWIGKRMLCCMKRYVTQNSSTRGPWAFLHCGAPSAFPSEWFSGSSTFLTSFIWNSHISRLVRICLNNCCETKFMSVITHQWLHVAEIVQENTVTVPYLLLLFSPFSKFHHALIKKK